MAIVLFPLGVRLSTWVVLGVFLIVGLRDRRFWLAAAVWLVGFEAFFELTSTVELLAHKPIGPNAWWALVVDFGAYVIGFTFVYAAARRGIVPSPILIGVAFAIWAVWVATGFHINSHTMAGFDPKAEALNEGVKTVWALAYLLPLWWASRSRGVPEEENGEVARPRPADRRTSASGATLPVPLPAGAEGHSAGPMFGNDP